MLPRGHGPDPILALPVFSSAARGEEAQEEEEEKGEEP